MNDALDNLVNFCRCHMAVYIYGAGKVGSDIAAYLEKNKIKISGFCVTIFDEDNTYLDYPVYEIDTLSAGENDGFVVAVTEIYADEIIRKLDQYKYDCFYDKACFEIIRAEMQKEKVQKIINTVNVSENQIVSIGKYRLSEDVFYIACPGSIGDTLYIAALVKELKKTFVREKTVCIIVKKNQESIAYMFPSIDDSIVDDELIEMFQLYSTYTGTFRLKNYLYGFAWIDIRHVNHMPGFQRKNLVSGYKTGIMGLSEDVSLEKMCIGGGRFSAHGKDKIILMPHESSAKRLPIAIWIKLIGKLQGQYDVYTNVKDNTEKILEGTKPISDTLQNMTGLCEDALCVISIRTGMCDLLAFTNANLIVLNTEKRLAEEWNLKEVFTRENIVNINCYDNIDNLTDEIFAQVEKFMFL